MVLEAIINPLKAEKKPWEMLIIGFVYCSVALFLGLWIFESHASLVMVFLTVLASIPLIYSTITLEEEKDLTMKDEHWLLKEHGKALSFFIFLFFGITIAITLWYVVLPSSLTLNLFSIQTQTISAINSKVTGNFAQSMGLVSKILLNSLKVLVFCLLFALVYGAGAIFILTWNASVIGVAIGNFIKSNLAAYSNYFHVTTFALIRYLTHGTFEILAYFIAGLAGGIISVAGMKHDFGSKKFEHVMIDSADLILIAIVILVVAAFIEVYVTPLFF